MKQQPFAILFSLSLVAAFVAVSSAAAPQAESTGALNIAAPAAAKIQFEKTALDFGEVQSNEKVKLTYIFTNIGNANLEIKEVRPACGCTAASDWDRKVEPGGTGKIPIEFNPSTFSGNVTKSVTVQCNDPKQPTIYLKLSGQVWKPIQITPTYVYFNVTGDSVSNLTKTVRIVNNTKEDLTLSDPVSTNQAFNTELKIVRPGKEFEVLVSLNPELELSRSMSTVTLNTSSTNMPLISFGTYAMVQEIVKVVPQQLVLPYGPLGRNNEFAVLIHSQSTTPLVLSDPTVTVPGAKVDLKETSPGRSFSALISFPPGFQAKPGQRMEFRVKTNRRSRQYVRIPITQTSLTRMPFQRTTPPMPRPISSLPRPTPPPPVPVSR